MYGIVQPSYNLGQCRSTTYERRNFWNQLKIIKSIDYLSCCTQARHLRYSSKTVWTYQWQHGTLMLYPSVSLGNLYTIHHLRVSLSLVDNKQNLNNLRWIVKTGKVQKLFSELTIWWTSIYTTSNFDALCPHKLRMNEKQLLYI